MAPVRNRGFDHTVQLALAAAAGVSLTAAQLERIDLEIFDVAYRIIGGGEEGDKTLVFTKEEADHSLRTSWRSRYWMAR